MAVRFRKIRLSEVDATRITLQVIRAEDGSIVGRVITLARTDEGAIELMSTAAADPPIAAAIALATTLAAFKEIDVDVVDGDDLWQPSWGRLERQ